MSHATSTSKRSTCLPASSRFLTRPQLLTRLENPDRQGGTLPVEAASVSPSRRPCRHHRLTGLSGDAVQEARSLLGHGR